MNEKLEHANAIFANLNDQWEFYGVRRLRATATRRATRRAAPNQVWHRPKPQPLALSADLS